MAVVIAAAASFAFASATHILSNRSGQVISNHLMTALPLTAGILAAFASRKHHGRERAAWTMLASWGVLSASGNALWEYYEFIAHRSVPFPSLADAGYLSGNLCAVVAIFLFSSAGGRASRGRVFLDAVLIATSTFLVAWVLLLDHMYDGPGQLLEKWVGLAYPLIDVIIVSLIVFNWSRASTRIRGSLSIIGLGLLGWVFSDTSFAFLTLRNAYRSGHPVDAGWIGGNALIALAALLAWRAQRTSAEHDSASPGRLRPNLPYVVAGAALVIAPISALFRSLDTAVLLGLIALLMLVLVRQFLGLLETKQVTIERLQSVDEMKNGILNAVSHELRTPLTYIKGTAYMLRDATLPDEIKGDLVEDLVKSSDRLEETLSGLLDLGRLARGILAPSRRPTEIAVLLLAVAQEVRQDDHQIRVTSGALTANVDPTQVERIVENLFTNAVRHTPPGTDIQAAAERTPDGLLITVEDDGPGVPDDIRDDIFKPFVQSDHTVSYGRGTGIGLSVVAKFAELHGGRAWVENSPSGGAKFCVTLREESTPEDAAA
jgi:signal transduction histidine kinase